MADSPDILVSALAEAAKPGAECAPGELLSAVATYPDPFRALSDHDDGNAIFDAIRRKFGFIDFVRATSKPPTAENMEKLVGLLRWLLRECGDWRRANDPHFHRLTALIVVAQYCGMGRNLWAAFPPGLENNGELLGELEALVARFSVTISAGGFSPHPISDSATLERFNVADRDTDWGVIGEVWPLIDHAAMPSVLVTQTVQCLHRFGPEYLVRGVSRLRQTWTAMQIVYALSPIGGLALGVASDNPYIEFASAYRAVSQPPKGSLDHDTQKSLAVLLVKVSGDEPRWTQWMHVFCRYSSQYPAIQAPLGVALATGKEAAVRPYVEAVVLYMTPHGRETVAECLRSFRKEATAERRSLLWGLAHRRWLDWNFGSTEENQHLTSIGTCELDYAIVGYALECMTLTERETVLASLREELSRIDESWHTSISGVTTAWNRLLSRFQPYAHAISIDGSSGDWLVKGKQYLPFDPKQDRYLVMTYRTGAS